MAGASGIRAGRAFVEIGMKDKLTGGLNRLQKLSQGGIQVVKLKRWGKRCFNLRQTHQADELCLDV